MLASLPISPYTCDQNVEHELALHCRCGPLTIDEVITSIEEILTTELNEFGPSETTNAYVNVLGMLRSKLVPGQA